MTGNLTNTQIRLLTDASSENPFIASFCVPKLKWKNNPVSLDYKHGLLWHGSFIALFLAGLVSIAQNFYIVVRGYTNNYKMTKCFLLHWTGFAYIINKKNWLFIRFSLLCLDCERFSFPIFLIIIKCMPNIQIMMNTKFKIGSC